jgi:hypothetical protein
VFDSAEAALAKFHQLVVLFAMEAADGVVARADGIIHRLFVYLKA